MTPGNRITVGDRIPDIELPDLEGRAHSLSRYRGQKLVVFLWASW